MLQVMAAEHEYVFSFKAGLDWTGFGDLMQKEQGGRGSKSGLFSFALGRRCIIHWLGDRYTRNEQHADPLPLLERRNIGYIAFV
jgi:hypothetical protein